MWVDSVGLLDFRSSCSLLGLMSYLLSFPSQPVTDSPAHDQFEVVALQPGQLFREQRHALTPRAGHARDVGAPEPARGAEGVVETVQMVVDVAKRSVPRAGGVARIPEMNLRVDDQHGRLLCWKGRVRSADDNIVVHSGNLTSPHG